MKRIALLSDTHGFLDEKILKFVKQADEIWHAGDFGTIEVCDKLASLKPLKGVYGNVDGNEIRTVYPLHQHFTCEKIKVWITHIGGYPGYYSQYVRNEIYTIKPNLFISGHSHILKVMRDKKEPAILHMNPGAAGIHGFHKIRTMMRFTIDGSTIKDVEAIELGLRGDIENLQ